MIMEKYDINEREFEMIELIANGYSNKEIAAELFLSEGTVRNYLSMILEKLQLRDRTQVAVFYYQQIGATEDEHTEKLRSDSRAFEFIL